jgi:hypothetical protein
MQLISLYRKSSSGGMDNSSAVTRVGVILMMASNPFIGCWYYSQNSRVAKQIRRARMPCYRPARVYIG